MAVIEMDQGLPQLCPNLKDLKKGRRGFEQIFGRAFCTDVNVVTTYERADENDDTLPNDVEVTTLGIMDTQHKYQSV
jgi:hypothetical protein